MMNRSIENNVRKYWKNMQLKKTSLQAFLRLIEKYKNCINNNVLIIH